MKVEVEGSSIRARGDVKRSLLLMVVLLVGAVAAAVYLLRVEEVRVVGVRSLSARSIVERSGLQPGDRILWERVTAAERRIAQIPAVADVTAERSLPSTIVIRITEREPIARLDGAPHLIVDGEGVIFDAGARDVRPALYGWKGRPRAGSRVDPASRRVLAAYETFPPLVRDYGRRIRVGNTFTLTLSGGTEIRFGSLRDLAAKAEVAESILRAERGHKLAYVDVRSPAVPVSRRKDEPTPSPGPAGVTPRPAPASAPTPAPTPAPATQP